MIINLTPNPQGNKVGEIIMKTILGIIIGITLTGTAVAYAGYVPDKIQVVDSLKSKEMYYEKIYDVNTNIVCYAMDGIYSGGISCVKNN